MTPELLRDLAECFRADGFHRHDERVVKFLRDKHTGAPLTAYASAHDERTGERWQITTADELASWASEIETGIHVDIALALDRDDDFDTEASRAP